MFCRLRQCRQILPKLNLSAILLLFLIKRAALGNLKVNFHCAHWHNLSPQGTGDVPTALSIVFMTPSVPLVGDRNVALNRFAIWLSDHQRSTPAAELQFFVRDEPPC